MSYTTRATKEGTIEIGPGHSFLLELRKGLPTTEFDAVIDKDEGRILKVQENRIIQPGTFTAVQARGLAPGAEYRVMVGRGDGAIRYHETKTPVCLFSEYFGGDMDNQHVILPSRGVWEGGASFRDFIDVRQFRRLKLSIIVAQINNLNAESIRLWMEGHDYANAEAPGAGNRGFIEMRAGTANQFAREEDCAGAILCGEGLTNQEDTLERTYAARFNYVVPHLQINSGGSGPTVVDELRVELWGYR